MHNKSGLEETEDDYKVLGMQVEMVSRSMQN